MVTETRQRAAVVWNAGVAALRVLQESVQLSPNSEMASLGLLHAFVNVGQMSEDTTQLERFLAANMLAEHRRILAELCEGSG